MAYSAYYGATGIPDAERQRHEIERAHQEAIDEDIRRFSAINPEHRCDHCAEAFAPTADELEMYALVCPRCQLELIDRSELTNAQARAMLRALAGTPAEEEARDEDALERNSDPETDGPERDDRGPREPVGLNDPGVGRIPRRRTERGMRQWHRHTQTPRH